MKETSHWIIGILLSVIFSLVTFLAYREMGRLDRNISVLHERVNGVIREKADKEDTQRESNFIWKEIDRLRNKK
jgi:predicted outer membrane lipoprotein